MPERSARLPLVFSCLGHSYMHLFTAFYFVIVLALEEAWNLPYHALIESTSRAVLRIVFVDASKRATTP